jgi:tetratricopeptide (TPR) repeat protein
LPKPSIGRAVAAAYRAEGLASALERYRVLRSTESAKWNVAASELNSVGYWLLRRDAIADSIAVFELNAQSYPDDPNVHDSLAEAYVAGGRLNDAISSATRAVELAEAANHPQLPSYRESLQQLKGRAGP